MKRIGDILLILMLSCSIFTKVSAQTTNMEQRVSWQYLDVRLEDALQNISEEYDVRFSYSSYYIPIDRLVSTRVENEPLGDALNDLFENTNVIYKSIGGQVVLKVDEKKRNSQSISYQYQPKPSTPKKTKPYEEVTTTSSKDEQVILPPVSRSGKQSMPSEYKEREEYIYKAPKVAKEEERPSQYHGMARAKVPQALMPIEMMPLTVSEFAAANGMKRKKVDIDLTKYKAFIEKIELEIATKLEQAGVKIEQKGADLELTINSTSEKIKDKRAENKKLRAERKAEKKEEKALKQKEESQEIEDEIGTGESSATLEEENAAELAEEVLVDRLAQFSLLPFVGTNFGKSREIKNNVSVNVFWGMNGGVEGLEVAGVANSVRKDMNGVQLAGFGNFVRGKVNGVQAAGFLNVAGEGGLNTQLAGFGNISGGNAGLQAAGLFNVAKGRVETMQVSSFFNKANYVRGIQIGLINVVDSIGFAPIGLINIVKSGRNKYNKVELATSEVFNGIVELKFGSKRLYNILHGALKWGGSKPQSWAMGFGIGTAFGWGRRSLINLEAIAMHVSEEEAFTSHLSLLNQVKLTYNLRFLGNLNVFIGPTFNLFLSNKYNSETGTIGTDLAPADLIINSNNVASPSVPPGPVTVTQTNAKGWVGLTGGLRF